MKKLSMVCALLCMPILGYGHESYTHEDDSFTYHYRVENGEACVTRITIENCDHVGGPDRIYKRMVRYDNNGWIIAEYPVTIIGDGNGIWNVFNDSLYHGCGVALQEGIREIRAGAFRNMNHYIMADVLDDGWEYVYLPTTLKTVGLNAFEGDTQIKHLRIDDLAAWCDIDFANAAANPLAYAKSLRLIDRNLIINGGYSYNVIKDLVIPDGVNEVKQYVFYNCEPLASVKFPWSCKAIGGFAFYGCTNISELVLHDNITSVGTNAFQGCKKLQTASFGSGLTSIPSAIFKDCISLASVVLGENVKTIESCAFEGCSSLSGLVLPNGIETIESCAFEGCSSLSGLVLPNSVKTIGDSAFANAPSLQYLIIPAGVENVGIGITMYCSRLLNIIGPRRLKSYFQICNPTAYYTYNDALISLDANGGELDRESVLVDLYSSVGELPAPFMCDHYFLGWFTAAEGGEEVTAETVVTGDMTLYAHWGEYTYNYIDNGDGTVTLSHYDENGDWIDDPITPLPRGEFAIPCEIDGKTVVAIGDYAFLGCEGLTGITIPNSVTSIEHGAFWYCVGLQEFVVAPDNPAYTAVLGLLLSKDRKTLIAVPGGLTSIAIPDSVTSIGDHAFEFCEGLTDVTIPEGMTSIGNYAFQGCYGLTHVTIPDSVTSIGLEAFHGCTGLADKDGFVIVRNVLYSYSGEDSEITIPDGVTSIDDFAFAWCNSLTSVTIPDSVTSIGDYAFAWCTSLMYVLLPETLQGHLNYMAFIGCSNIINIPVFSIVDGLLYGVELNGATEIVIPDSVTDILGLVFSNCSGLTDVTIPDSVTNIGEYAFNFCSSLKSVIIGDGVMNIGDGAFVFCSGLTNVVIGSSVTNIGMGVFSCCSGLTSVTIPDSVTSIGGSAFESCSGLASITIPDGVTSIGELAFCGCRGLMDVLIPASVTDIGDGAFSECDGLLSFAVAENNVGYKTESGILVSKDGKTLVAVPGGMTDVTIPDSVTSIGSRAFSGCDGLTSVTIPEGVTNIGDYAFAWCDGLKSVTIPDSVTSIGEGAFAGCVGLADTDGFVIIRNVLYSYSGEGSEIMIPDGITCVGASAFQFYAGLTSVIISDSVTSIGDGAFAGCSGLTSVTIPDSVTSIGDGAFAGCSGLTSVTIPEGMTSIGNYAFQGCDGLTHVTIPDSVTSIGDYTFSLCSSLAGVTIPNGVTSIGDYAFTWCNSLASVTIPDSVTSIGEGAFTGCALTDVYLPKSLEGHLDTSIVFDPSTSIHYRSNDNALPEVAEDAAPEAVTNAIAEVGFADAGVMGAIGGSAEEYKAFKDWAASVKVAGSASGVVAGEAAVIANTNAAAAYLLGAERLFENSPTIEIGELVIADGESLGTTAMAVSVTVKDGEDAVKCTAEKVKDMFEATSDIGDWNGSARMSPTVTVEKGEEATMRFKVTPGDGTANRAFLRIKR